jgi:two-component system, NarL family, response regulator NreC
VCPHTQTEREGAHSERTIRCVLAHEHVLLRQGLRRLLEDDPHIEVAAEAGSTAEALAMVAAQRPDVVITDADTFRCAAYEAEQMILQESPHSRVLFLTLRGDDEAHGDRVRRLTRQTSAEELIEVLKRMGSIDKAVVRAMPRRSSEDRPVEKLRPKKRGLTAREREVLELLAAGRTVRSAAKILGLSIKTVDAHKFNLMRKLEIHNKAELVMWAIQKRIVKLPANF